MSADDVLPRPARDVDLRHGYTLDQVNGLSIWAVMRQRWHQFADFDERLEIAWHAMIEHIYTSNHPPAVADVVRAGWRAIGQHAGRDEQFRRGYSHNRDARVSTGFERYWHSAGQPVSGPEERVTEDLALAQIWARLRPDHRALLAAMAEHEDYGRAAAALGKSRHSYATEIGRARRAFRELWHEGETPSRPWGVDRRPFKADSPQAPVTYRLIVRRRAALARSGTAPQAGSQQRDSRPVQPSPAETMPRPLRTPCASGRDSKRAGGAPLERPFPQPLSGGLPVHCTGEVGAVGAFCRRLSARSGRQG